MPTYEYKCVNCGHKFEMFQSMTAAPLSDCPKCNLASSLKRLIGRGSGIIFKGSGFYQTDYKNNSTSISAAVKGDISSSSSSAKSSSTSDSNAPSSSTAKKD